MTARKAHPLRPFMPVDTIPLRELFAQSIEELTQDEYDEDQRAAWAAQAADAQEFAKRLGAGVTLIVQIGGEYAGFGVLRDNVILDMLYVHPYHANDGVGSSIADALERIAAARGASEITAEVSETAQVFFEERGYVSMRRNSVPVDDVWLTNTTMTKKLTPIGSGRPS